MISSEIATVLSLCNKAKLLIAACRPITNSTYTLLQSSDFKMMYLRLVQQIARAYMWLTELTGISVTIVHEVLLIKQMFS